MGWVEARSRRNSSMTRSCAAVRSNGNPRKNFSSNSPRAECTWPASRTDQQLHREKFGEHQVLAGGVTLRCRRREMDFVEGVLARSEIRVLRQQRRDRPRIKILECLENHRAEHPLREALGCGIDRRDPAKVNGHFVVVLDDLEFGMLHAKAFPAQARLSENHEALASRNHLLDVVKVEPTQNERLAEGVRIRFFQSRLKDFLPAAEP
jgi:hypothetical protein